MLVGVPPSGQRPFVPIGTAPPAAVVRPNDNRVPAGFVDDTVLRVSLVAQRGRFYPEGSGVGIDVAAFGEEGKGLQTPGPLIRMRSAGETYDFEFTPRVGVSYGIEVAVGTRRLSQHIVVK